MFHVVLYEPEIPQNTGSIIRLCANAGFQLHLIYPLGFDFDDKKLKRAGLDYQEYACIKHHANFEDFLQKIAPTQLFACSTKGRMNYAGIRYQAGDAFVFGPETRGLPTQMLTALPQDHVIKIPMQAKSRSINLSNATSIILYEAWRQQNFIGSQVIATDG